MGAWFFGDAASVRAQVARAGVAILRVPGQRGAKRRERKEKKGSLRDSTPTSVTETFVPPIAHTRRPRGHTLV